MSPRARAALIALELVTAANAIGGAIYGLSGAPGVPRDWLDGTPFGSYLVPSLILLIAVGGSMLLAAAAELRRRPHAAELSMAAGAILAVWIVVEALMIPFSPLQPLFLAIAVLVIALAARRQFAGSGA